MLAKYLNFIKIPEKYISSISELEKIYPEEKDYNIITFERALK